MFDTDLPCKVNINLEEYKDKVLGCWTGKNVGGTLGAPFEGKREMNDATFYVQNLDGNPAPNDDLDLQLVWLQAAEEHGTFNVTPRLLGEYWMNFIVGPWNEYSVCKANIANGLYPPLSGSCNNSRWEKSNGAWIRSEIWACLFPGSPDEACLLAYADSCCDHANEGIYAELFTASLESAAFVISDVRKLIDIGLSKIPTASHLARSVKLACKLFDDGVPFKEAREAIVKDNEDLGWFQAPGNVAFAILGLLYGKGDFGKSICLATNCGDDTDCTAATVGSILGIIKGRSGIPEKWLKPIGESIKTVAVAPFGLDIPKDLQELSARTVALALKTRRENPTLVNISEAPSGKITEEFVEKLFRVDAVEKRIWKASPYELLFPLSYGNLAVDYDGGPYVVPGEAKKVTVYIRGTNFREAVAKVSLKLPEGWQPIATEASINCVRCQLTKCELSFVPGPFASSFVYLPLEVRLAGRFNYESAIVPFQRREAVNHCATEGGASQEAWDGINRRKAQRKLQA